MPFDPNLYNETYRIPTARAEWWQYGGGIYFVTIKTKNAIQYFGRIIRNPKTHQNEMIFSELGEYVNEIIPKISEHQWYAHVPVWTVMPNHVHVLIMIDERGRNDGLYAKKCCVGDDKMHVGDDDLYAKFHCTPRCPARYL